MDLKMLTRIYEQAEAESKLKRLRAQLADSDNNLSQAVIEIQDLDHKLAESEKERDDYYKRAYNAESRLDRLLEGVEQVAQRIKNFDIMNAEETLEALDNLIREAGEEL